jgi:VIT1/CCC1 family predicted Fe2+/Mn2+ transporter
LFWGCGRPNAAYIGTGLAAAGLFGTGSAMSLFTGRNPWMGGLRMLAIGAAAGATVFVIGALIGVEVG